MATSKSARNLLWPLLQEKKITPYFMGMGTPTHALNFARKIRLDLDQWDIYVDPGSYTGQEPQEAVQKEVSHSSCVYPAYDQLGLINTGGMLQFYRTTLDANTIVSSTRAVLAGHLPTYGQGGSLTQLGGTFIMDGSPLSVGNVGSSCNNAQPSVTFSHVETKTGGHPSVDELCRVIERLD